MEKTLRYSIRILGLLLAVFAAGARAQDGVPVKVVPSLSFVVTVEPANEESRDAKSAELYISRFPDKGWVLDGVCTPKYEESGLMFARAVTVPADGAYYFTSKGVDAVGASPAPLRGERPQVRVIADTTPPQMELKAPKPGQILRAGEQIRIEWSAADINLAPHPVTLEYSADGGHSWRTVGESLANTGHHFWALPENLDGALLLRGSCVDLAGNRGVDTAQAAWKVLPKITAPELAESAAPVRPPVARVEVRPIASATAAYTSHLNDPRPATNYPELDANSPEIPQTNPREGRAAYVAYIMAGNLVRQGRLKDSLRYYRTAVDIDGNFAQAWNDMALVYKQLGAYAKADACIVKALRVSPDEPRYLNTRGGIYQSAGFEILRDPASGEESLARASDLILFAVKTYGQVIDVALRQGRLGECAETYFHLGEICYFANQDPQGARQYWLKVLDLHTPTPDLDNVIFDQGTPEEKLTRGVYEKNTEMWVNLQTWQSWSREYIRQLNRLESGAALPTAPFAASHFQRFVNPHLGEGTQPMAAMPGAFGLNMSGNYAGEQVQGCPVGQGGTMQGGATGPWYYSNTGQPVAAPTTHFQAAAPQGAPADPQQHFLRTGECYTSVQQGNSQPSYQPRGAEMEQSRMLGRNLPPQGPWNSGSYGNAPDYTYRTPGTY